MTEDISLHCVMYLEFTKPFHVLDWIMWKCCYLAGFDLQKQQFYESTEYVTTSNPQSKEVQALRFISGMGNVKSRG